MALRSMARFLAGAEAFDWARARWLPAGSLPTRRADHTAVALAPPGAAAAAGPPLFLVLGGVNELSKQATHVADFFRPGARSLPAGAPEMLPLDPLQLRAGSCVALRLGPPPGGAPAPLLVLGPAGGASGLQVPHASRRAPI